MALYETVIVSDLHLGAANARHDELLRFLDDVQTNHLIINGDLFDRPHLGKLRDADIRVLDQLRQFALDRRLEWLVGNHDPSPIFFRSVLGIDAKDETLVDVGPRRYLVYHGHGWDRALTWPWWIVAGADSVYRASQLADRSHKFARFLKRRCKRFVKAVDNLRDRAVAEAQHRGLGGVVLGHSHVSSDERVDGVHYLNSGCWTENPATYIGIRDGVARREFFMPETRTIFAIRPTRIRRGNVISSPAELVMPLPAPLGIGERA